MPQLDTGVLAQPERLRAHLLLSSSSAPVDGLVRLAARSVVAPVGLLTLVDDERMHVVGRHGLPPHLDKVRAEPATSSFCQFVVSEDRPLVVQDARTDPVLRDLGVVHSRDITAYLGQPLHDAAGLTLGAVCVTDSVPRHWTDDDVTALAECAGLLEMMRDRRASAGAGARAAGWPRRPPARTSRWPPRRRTRCWRPPWRRSSRSSSTAGSPAGTAPPSAPSAGPPRRRSASRCTS